MYTLVWHVDVPYFAKIGFIVILFDSAAKKQIILARGFNN